MINWGYSVCFSENKPLEYKDKVFPITCPICGAHTDSEIIDTFETQRNKYIKLPDYDMKIHNYLLRCTRCSSAILLLWSYGNGKTAGMRLYPFYTDAFSIKDIDSDAIPKSIYEDIKQAELSYLAGAYYGAGLLLRSACQNICRDKEAKGKNLFEEIDHLEKNGLITKPMAEMAHAIRIIGNEIAHPNPNTVFVVTQDDVEHCQEFVKQLVFALYTNPHKLKKFQDSMKERGLEAKAIHDNHTQEGCT